MIVEDVGIPTEANLLPDNPDDRRRKPGRRSNADAKIKHTVKAKKSTGYSPKTSIESRGSVNLPTQSKVDGGATLLQSWINNDQINIGSPRTTHHQNSMIEPQIAFASSHPQSPIHLSHVQPPAVLYESLSAAENEYKAKVAAIESLAARKTTKRHRDRTEQTIPISPAVITLLKQQLVALTIASKEQSMHIATLEQELSVANEREIKILTTFEAWKNEANQNLEAARTEIKALKAKFAEKESGTAKSFKSQIRDLELELYREQLKSQGLESKVRNLELTLAQEREDRNKDQQYGAADHVKALVRELDVLQDAARKAEARDGENEHLTRMWRVASEQVDSTKNKLDGLYEKLKESLDKAKSSPRSEIA
ncbi:hypothetical protein BJ742DRAFT_864389 [Cladochytrium replicatum]|nr:hypothetical protein BJ742DRAFT_864389 [Cladochytrium replicatum]